MSEMSTAMFIIGAALTLVVILALAIVCGLAWGLWQHLGEIEAEKPKATPQITSPAGGMLQGYTSDTTARMRGVWQAVKVALLACAMLGGLALAGHWLTEAIMQDPSTHQEPTK